MNDRKRKHAELLDEEDEKKRKDQKSKALKELGYSDETNPFGDPNLSKQFVWKKKKEKEQQDSKSKKIKTDEVENQKQLELVEKAKELKEKRKQKEMERKELEKEREKMMREREREHYDEWKNKEEDFHRKQTITKSEVRLKEGRAKQIDLLVNNLKFFENQNEMLGDEIEVREPFLIFERCDTKQIKEFLKEIRAHLEASESTIAKQFWTHLKCIGEYYLQELQNDSLRNQSTALHSSIKNDIFQKFQNKSFEELESIERETQFKIDNPDGTIDIEYWEHLLIQLQLLKSKAWIKAIHSQILDLYLQHLLHKKQIIKMEQMQNMEQKQLLIQSLFQQQRDATAVKQEPLGEHAIPLSENSSEQLQEQQWMLQMIQAANDRHQLDVGWEEGDDEFDFADEIGTLHQVYSWSDRFRPRKPKYFNRVHTGYDWNKYNSTHYDKENPPPKVIQGYKFNIFYPDLINKNIAPKYFIEEGETKETCVLRFHAGPPYEDIAFRIVNREWETSHRRGFKCVFDRGVLQLHFNFKRYKYKR